MLLRSFFRILSFFIVAITLVTGYLIFSHFNSRLPHWVLTYFISFILSYLVFNILILIFQSVLKLSKNFNDSGKLAFTFNKKESSLDNLPLNGNDLSHPESADGHLFELVIYLIPLTFFWFWTEGPHVLLGLPSTSYTNSLVDKKMDMLTNKFNQPLLATFAPALVAFIAIGVALFLNYKYFIT